MASQLPGYEYDIFISYRHNDNRTGFSSGSGANDGWVSDFVANLSLELEATVKGKVCIYFDKNPSDGLLETHNVEESLSPKIKSLIFIPILSQTYCDPESYAWRHEFLAFNKMTAQDKFGAVIKLLNGNATNRVLPIRIHELDNTDMVMLEAELKGKLRSIDFIFKAPGVNRPLRAREEDPLKNTYKTFYRDQINKTANAVKEIINGLKNFEKTPFVAEEKKHFPSMLLAMDAKVPSIKTVAVLPFRPEDTDSGTEYLGEGIAEDIILTLSRIRDLKVLSRSQSFQMKTKGIDTKHSATLVQGTVKKTKDVISAVVQLTKGDDQPPFWSKTYTMQTDDMGMLSNKVSADIVDKLAATILDREKIVLLKVSTHNGEAYDAFLKGRYCFHQKGVHLTKSLKFFQEAVQLDPLFANGYVHIAEVSLLLCYDGRIAFQEGVTKARESAFKALELDPTLTEAYSVLAFISMCYEWTWPEVEPLFRRVFSINQLNPKSDEKYSSLLKQIKSNLEESGTEAPNTIPYFLNAYAMLHLGEFEQALSASEEAVRRDPGSFMAHRALGLSYLGLERFEPAIKALEEAATLSNRHQWLLFELMGAYTQAGRREDALAIMDETMSQANIVSARIYNFLFPHST